MEDQEQGFVAPFHGQTGPERMAFSNNNGSSSSSLSTLSMNASHNKGGARTIGEESTIPMVAVNEEQMGMVGTSSIAKGIFNVLCALVGGGLLGLSHALRLAGWYGIIMLVALGFIATYTAILISRCLNYSPCIRSYSDIGVAAFGKVGKIVVYICQFGSCLGCSIIYLILVGQNISTMLTAIPGVPSVFVMGKFWSIVAAVIVLPLCYMKNLDDFAFMSLIGMILSLITTICIIIGVFLVPSSQTNHDYGGVSFTSFLSAFATMAFSYAGHCVFPDVQRVMKEPRKFNRVVYFSFGICVILYVITASLGYYTFGELTKDNILLNLGNQPASIIAKIAVTAHVIFGYVVFINPVFFGIERRLGFSRNKRASLLIEGIPKQMDLKVLEQQLALQNLDFTNGNNKPMTDNLNDNDKKEQAQYNDTFQASLAALPKESKFKKMVHTMSWPVLRILVRTLIVAFTLLVAVFLPFFGDLMGFIGGSTLSLTFLILPALFFLKLFWKSIPLWEKTWNIFLILFGLLGGGVACVVAIINIVSSAGSWSF